MHAIQFPVVSSVTAGVLIIFQMLLLLAVVFGRYRYRQGLGDGGNPGLLRAMRRHGNLAENGAIFVVCAALLEMMGGTRETLEILCGVFLAARLFHAFGLTIGSGPNLFRFLGVLGTFGACVGVGWRLIVIALPQLHGGYLP